MTTAIERTPIQRFDKTQAIDGSVPFETYLYNWAQFIGNEQSYNLPLTYSAVALHIRSRGATISDLVSNYGVRAETQGTWIQYDPALDGEVHPINIVGPTFTVNMNACLQSNSETLIKSANESALHKQIAQRWQRVSDYLERTGWNEAKRGFIFHAVQCEGTNLIEVTCKPQGKQSIPRVEDTQKGLAVYQCESCGKTGLTATEQVEEVAEIPCPQCGQPAQAKISAYEGKALAQDEVPVYEIDNTVIPFFNFTIDTYGAKIGGIQTANWLQIQRLRDFTYMQTHYPTRHFSGTAPWSYQLRADYALAQQRTQYLNSQPIIGTGWGLGHERYEERAIYLHEDSYTNYVAPDDYSFISPWGQKTFSIRKGQTIMEAQEECYGENQHGFKYHWCDQALLNIPDNKGEELNFRDRFSDVHWSRESGSYLSAPYYSIVSIQDDLTLLNTMSHNIVARNAVNQVVYDSLAFEKGDFSNEYVGTKNTALLPDADIRKSVFSLPIPTPSPYLSQQMQWLFSIKDSVTQVTPALRGETQRDQPYAAQRQQLEQSYGNLTSVLKSFAQMKCNDAKNKFKAAKKWWTLEQFQRVASAFGEIWVEEDVEEMCEIDFDRDLIVTYREGSELPATPLTKEIKFFSSLQQLAQIPPELALQIITPEKWANIIEKIGEYGEMGFDVSGLEIDEMIAQKRYQDVSAICQVYANWTFDAVENAKNHVVQVIPPDPQAVQEYQQAAAQGDEVEPPQPTQVTALDLITEEIFNKAQIRFSPYEDLDQEKTFFIEQLRAEIGKTKPNYILIEMLQTLLGFIEQALDAQQQEKLAKDPQVQAAQAADAAVKEAESQKRQLEMARLQGDIASKKADIDLKTKEIEIKAQQADRDAMLDLAKHAADGEVEPETAEEEIPLVEQVSSTISYKDAPPSIKRQMEAEVGFKPATAAEAKLEMDAKKQEAKPKPVLSKPKKN